MNLYIEPKSIRGKDERVSKLIRCVLCKYNAVDCWEISVIVTMHELNFCTGWRPIYELVY